MMGFIFLLVLNYDSQKVEIKVRMDCDGCERKVKKSIEGMKGVTSIEVNRKHHKLTVEGYVEPNKVVERVRKKTGKRAELWPYVPYKLVTQPYAAGTYDKKAPFEMWLLLRPRTPMRLV
ncbi:Heavy metal-associated isoprenylated plant protein 26 [Nymphaea thermarum]|nr:Heavy metal-associated isoprenylated plant protein 26 [Nymphaea thermarum]